MDDRTSHSTPGAVASTEGSAPCQVSMTLVRALAEVAQQRGVPLESLMESATSQLFDEPRDKFVPFAEYENWLSRAQRLACEPGLLLHCGMEASESSFGLIAPLITHSRSLRHALALLAEFQTLVVEGATLWLWLEERSTLAELRCQVILAESELRTAFDEFAMAGLFRMLRTFGCLPQDVARVCFTHPRPVHAQAYDEVFGCKAEFSQPFMGIQFAAEALDRPHLHYHMELHSLLLGQAERRIERRAKLISHAERVRALMRSSPPGDIPGMEAIAGDLGLSVRSLRRRLTEEGTSYRELVRAALFEAACELLRNPDITLQAIGYTLGFSDSTAFHRAFKRWADCTPAEYRAARARPVRLGVRTSFQ